ncbi:hypothetical protein ACF3NG_09920 [Aerococcaceae bacterium WGS1372]
MSEKMLNRMIYGIIIVFCATPFLFLFYLNLTANLQNTSLVELLRTNAIITVQMLSIFLLPLAAYILKMKWDKVQDEESHHVLYISIALLMLSMFLLNNMVHGLLVLILLIFVTKYYRISIKEIFVPYTNNWKSTLITYSGELTILVLSMIIGVVLRGL